MAVATTTFARPRQAIIAALNANPDGLTQPQLAEAAYGFSRPADVYAVRTALWRLGHVLPIVKAGRDGRRTVYKLEVAS